ncbi:MAG: hypothetical protein ACXWZT_12800 [Gaiellaceae bacterium]
MAWPADGIEAQARARSSPAPAGEQHDLSLIVFGLALREHGWRITYLGADTPITTIDETAATVQPDLVVVAAVDPARLSGQADALHSLTTRFQLALAGAGASPALVAEIGATHLDEDPIEAAATVASRR